MFDVVIRPDGLIQFIHAEGLEFLQKAGTCEIRRVSHVEPVRHITENCNIGWSADMSPVGGPVLGPFRLRSQALAAELKWLQNNLNL